MNPRTRAASYDGWRRERLGVFAGLTGTQASLVGLLALPMLVAMGRSHWIQVIELLPITLLGMALVAVPVRGRPAARWLGDLLLFQLGRAAGWSTWVSRAATGAATPEELASPDLPGVIAGLRLHDGPPFGPFGPRVCVIQDPRPGRWTAVARLSHPGVAAADEATRDAYAAELGGLLAAAADSEHIAGLSLLIRTVPDDGAERAAWVADHETRDVPPVVASAGRALEASVVAASVRHEVFLTVSVAETRVRRAARDAGGGASGRARVLYRYLGELEQRLRAVGVTDVRWLDSADLATAVRTGYNLADAAGLARASQAERRGFPVSSGTLMGAAGPANASPPAARSYTHDAFTTVSYALLLPKRPTTVGALSRVLAPANIGERRCLALHYEPLPPRRADRQIDRDTWAAEMAVDVRAKRGFRVPRRDRKRLTDVAEQENQLARGHSLVRVAGAASVTVPAGGAIEDAAAAFEGSARAAGYQLLRLDLAQDSGFVAAVLPLGVGLHKRGER
jgi:Putative type VII ESX secretion system translocon, EccE